MKKILVSKCLYMDDMEGYEGEGRGTSDPLFSKWKEEGRLIPVCPEALGGRRIIGVDAERYGDKVLAADGSDITAEYKDGASKVVKFAEENNIACAILRETSPFCGSNYIYDGNFTKTLTEGMGMAAESLRAAGFKVFSEKEISEAEKFVNSLEQQDK